MLSVGAHGHAGSHACLFPHLCPHNHGLTRMTQPFAPKHVTSNWPACAPAAAASAFLFKQRPAQVGAATALASSPPSTAASDTQAAAVLCTSQPAKVAHGPCDPAASASTSTHDAKKGSGGSVVAKRLQRILKQQHSRRDSASGSKQYSDNQRRSSREQSKDTATATGSSSAYVNGDTGSGTGIADAMAQSPTTTGCRSTKAGSASTAHKELSSASDAAPNTHDTSQPLRPRGPAVPAVNESEIATEAAKMNPVYRLIRKTELQMARRPSMQQHGMTQDVISNPNSMGDSSHNENSTEQHACGSSKSGFTPAVMDSEMAWEGARMNPVYRMIRKTELQMKKGTAKASTSPATSSPQTGLASLFSLSESLLSFGELGWDDPGSQLAETLDPGRRSSEGLLSSSGLQSMSASVPLPIPTAVNSVGALRPWEKPKRLIRRPDQAAAAAISSAAPQSQAPPQEQAPRYARAAADRSNTTMEHSTGNSIAGSKSKARNSDLWQQEKSVPVCVEETLGSPADVDYWPTLPRFPSTGHAGVDRTIRIRQLSLAQRKKQQAMAAAQHQQLWQLQEDRQDDQQPFRQALWSDHRGSAGSDLQTSGWQEEWGHEAANEQQAVNQPLQIEQRRMPNQQQHLQHGTGKPWQPLPPHQSSAQQAMPRLTESLTTGIHAGVPEEVQQQPVEPLHPVVHPPRSAIHKAVPSTRAASTAASAGICDVVRKRGRPRKPVVCTIESNKDIVVASADGQYITLPGPRRRSRPSSALAGLSASLAQTATLATGFAKSAHGNSRVAALETPSSPSAHATNVFDSSDAEDVDMQASARDALHASAAQAGTSVSIAQQRRKRWLTSGNGDMAAAAAALLELLGLGNDAWEVPREVEGNDQVLASKESALERVQDMLLQQPSLAARTSDSLAANLTALARVLGVPKTRVIDAVLRYPPLLELAPVTVWLRHRHLMQLVARHSTRHVRPLDVAEAVCQCPTLLGLSTRMLTLKLHVLASFHAASIQHPGNSLQADTRATVAPDVSVPESSSQQVESHATDASARMMQPQQAHAMPGATTTSCADARSIADNPNSASMAWALDMLLQFPGLARCSAALLSSKCQKLGAALQLQPRWQTDAAHMTPAYLARCLGVSDKVLLRLHYVAHATSKGDKTAVSKYAVAEGVRDVTAVGYLLLLSQSKFDARFPGFQEWCKHHYKASSRNFHVIRSAPDCCNHLAKD